MERLSFYLEKFHLPLPYELTLKKTLAEIIQQKFGAEISSKNINLQGRTLYLKVKPALKSAILIHREEILAELQKKLQELNKKTNNFSLI